jgi:hypothetical protein
LTFLFGYNAPHNCIHFYAWQALAAMDQSTDSFLDNIKSPIQCNAAELEEWNRDLQGCPSITFLVPLLLVMG